MSTLGQVVKGADVGVLCQRGRGRGDCRSLVRSRGYGCQTSSVTSAMPVSESAWNEKTASYHCESLAVELRCTSGEPLEELVSRTSEPRPDGAILLLGKKFRNEGLEVCAFLERRPSVGTHVAGNE